MDKAKLKATDLTVILFIKHQLDYEPLKTKPLLKSIFNFILIKVQDPVGSVKRHIAVANERDVSLLLIDDLRLTRQVCLVLQLLDLFN